MAATSIDPGKVGKLFNDLDDISFTQIGLIIIGAWAIVFISRIALTYIAKKTPGHIRLYLLGSVPIIRLLLLITAIFLIVPIVFNVTFQNFIVIAGAASVAIGFAFKDYASSLIAGVVALVERPYRPGDWVKIDGDYGEVTEVGMRALRLRTADDDVVTVPHDKLWKTNISNSNDGERTLMCVAHFYVLPDHDGAKVVSNLNDVALTSAYLEYEKPVLITVTETPLGTHYQLKAYPFDMRDQFMFISDLTIRGKIALHNAGASAATTLANTDAKYTGL